MLPPEIVLPKIITLFKQQAQENQKLANSILEYIDFYKFNPYVFSFIEKSIISEDTDLQQKFSLIGYLHVFPLEKVLPIVKKIYTKQDIVRLSIAKLLSFYKDNETKDMLIYYLSDEIADIQFQAAKSLIERKEWDTLPLLISKIKNSSYGEKLREILLQIEDVEACRYFFMYLPLFDDMESKKIFIIQSSKYKNIYFLPTYFELYKKEKNNEIKQLLKETIQKCAVDSSKEIFIAYLQDIHLWELIIPILVKINSDIYLPYLIQIYDMLPVELQNEVDNCLLSINSSSLIYSLSHKLDTKTSLKLRCIIIKWLLQFDENYILEKIKDEVIKTKNKQILSAVIDSLQKINNHDKQIMLTKLLTKKVCNDTQLLYQLLNQIEKIVQQKKYNYMVLVDDLAKFLDHKEDYIAQKSFEIINNIFKNSSIENLKVIYPMILYCCKKKHN